jgi:hypothetical protein
MTSRWIKIKEAAQYSAIGIHRLKELGRSGIVKGFQDPDSKRGDWVFDRDSIDAYREAQCSPVGAREKALALMRGVRL